MEPKTPLVVSHITDRDEFCGILTNDNGILIPEIPVKWEPMLRYLVHRANLYPRLAAFVRNSTCECYDSFGNKFANAPCDRCRLIAKIDAKDGGK